MAEIGAASEPEARVWVIHWARAGERHTAHVAGPSRLAHDLAALLPAAATLPDDEGPVATLVAARGAAGVIPVERLGGCRRAVLLDPTDADRRPLLRVMAGRAEARLEALSLPSTVIVAEHTLLLLLALAGRLLPAYSALIAGVWARRGRATGDAAGARDWAAVPGRVTLDGRTLGILGLGRAGEAVAARARGLGMRVIYADREPKPAAEVRYGLARRRFDQLLREADVVSLHLPLTPETFRILDAPEIALMKPSALLIDTADGRLIDEGALIKALRHGDIAGAGLDVFAYEPLPADSPLIALDNVVLTPRVAGLPARQERAMLLRQAADLLLAPTE